MPITKVQGPDGKVIKVEHPEGASQDQIIAFAQRQAAPVPAAKSTAGTIADPLAQGATFGFADEIVGALGAIPNALFGKKLSPEADKMSAIQGQLAAAKQSGNQAEVDRLRSEMFGLGSFTERPGVGESYTGIRDTARSNLGDYRERNPGTALAAEVAGGLLTGGVGAKRALGGAAARNAGNLVARSGATGAGMGLLSGAGYSEADTAGGVAMDAAQGGLLGGVTGMAFPAAGQFLAKTKRAAQRAAAPSQNYTRAARLLKREGVPLTGGQVRGSNWQKVVEEQLGDTPIIGTPLQRVAETQRKAFQKGLLRKIGVDEGDGLIDLNKAKSTLSDLSKEYGQALKDKFINIADDDFLDQLAAIEQKHTQIIDDASEGKIRSIVNKFLQRATEGNGAKTGEWYQRQRSLFAKRAQGTSDTAGLYGDLVEALDDAFERVAPAVKGDLDKRWSMARQLVKVAESGGAEVSEGILPIASLNRLAKTKPGTEAWKSYVNSGATVLPARVGNSGTATRQMANDFVRGGVLTGAGIAQPGLLLPMAAARGVSSRLASGKPIDVTQLMPGGGLLRNPRAIAPAANAGLLVSDP